MKVWIVHRYAVKPTEPGGARPFTLAKELASRGHDVTLVAGSFNHWSKTDSKLSSGEKERVEVVDGVRIVWIKSMSYQSSGPRRLIGMIDFGRRVKSSPLLASFESPDIIIGSSPHPFSAMAALKLAKRLKAAFVYEVRDLWPQSLIDLGHFSENHPLIVLMRRMESSLVQKAKAIVTLPPVCPTYFEEKGAETKAVFWIPNGVNVPDLPPVQPIPDSQVCTFTFVGVFGLAYAFDTLLEAASQLQKDGHEDKINFKLVGDGWEKPRIVKRAEELGLKNVSFVGAVPKSDVHRLMAESDAGLLPLKRTEVYRWGISPNKLFDYFGAGRPVLFSGDPGNNPVDEAGAGISVMPDNPAGLAQAALELAQMSRKEREAMGARGRDYVERNHDLSELVTKLEDALYFALDGRGSSPAQVKELIHH